MPIARNRFARSVSRRARRPHDDSARTHPAERPASGEGRGRPNATLNCGWGRLLFCQTFEDPKDIAEAIAEERPDRRDIAFYVRDPHVVLAQDPQQLFLDPSHTYRLPLARYRASRRRPSGFFVRRLSSQADADAVNRIYLVRSMVPAPPEFYWQHRDSRAIAYFIAEDKDTGAVLGAVTAVDHRQAFDDPERGSSLWCLAVDPQATRPGVGEALVRRVLEHAQARGAHHLDLSVMHDNEQAIGLYEKLGFKRLPCFAIKRKNPINENLYIGPNRPDDRLNPYAQLIVDEARRRGIGVEVLDAPGGFFRLNHGGRSIRCRESLSEMTSGVAVAMCDDKAVSRRMAERAGVRVPAEIEVTEDLEPARAFWEDRGKIVVKPARGEQGQGVAVGLTTWDEAEAAIRHAQRYCERVLIEECVEGDDLRLIVIDYRLVAAALRKPARVIGDGRRTVRALIEAQSRRRAAATGGESKIPLDAETERCVKAAGYGYDDVPDEGAEIAVRKTANLHTGGTIHDVTDHVHPTLVSAAVKVARALLIPVVGVDLIVPSPRGADYVFIEANERPGLANHEPQPTAERFVDLLFPLSMPAGARELEWRRQVEAGPAEEGGNPLRRAS